MDPSIAPVCSGRKIVEGGQAAIYEVGPKYDHEKWFPGVVKVFKAGYSLRDLQNQWLL